MRRAYRLYQRQEYGPAVDAIRAALEAGESPLLLYNLACYESLAGSADDALLHLRRAIALEPSYRELARDDADFDAIRDQVSEL